MRRVTTGVLPAIRCESRAGRGLCVLLCASLLSGCLSASYEIPRDELERIVHLPAAERGRSLHAVQRFSTAPDPPPGPTWAGPKPRGADAYDDSAGPDGYGGGGVYFWPDVYMGYGHPHHGPRFRSSVTGGEPAGHVPGGMSTSAPTSASKSTTDGKSLIAGVIVVGVVVGIGLAVTEGVRYDGRVAVHPQHPVHLLDDSGHHTQVPLADLRADHIQDGREAVIVGNEGGGLWHRGRGPLDRAGGTYRFGWGWYNQTLNRDTAVAGHGADLAVGLFPTQWSGLLWSNQLVGGDDRGGEFWTWRSGVEGQWYPFQFQALHLGAYGAGGLDTFGASGGDLPTVNQRRLYVGAGGLVEIELATRLAFTFRAGGHWLPMAFQDDGKWSFAFGLSVY